LNPLVAWVKERESIRKKKEAGLPLPWTDDVIFQQFRFCNAYREYDKVTRWISQNWREPNKGDPDLWFALAVARHLNLPETLRLLGYPVPWSEKKFLTLLRKRKSQGLTSYNAAYMIRASKDSDKAGYLAEKVFKPLWKNRKALRPVVGDTLENFHQRLFSQFGLGSFMAAQIVADMKYVEPLKSASDWWEFAASGPGSRRGLNRLLGRDVKAHWREKDWREELAKFRVQIKPEFEEHGLAWCTASDAQNQMCETDKYLRVKLGEGRPKQRYRPSMLG
jgi:hypothetical protein